MISFRSHTGRNAFYKGSLLLKKSRISPICGRPQGLRLARELKDDYSVFSIANYLACALIFGGRLPFSWGEIKALSTEACEASRRAKKYITKLVLASYQQQIVDEVRDGGSIYKLKAVHKTSDLDNSMRKPQVIQHIPSDL